MPLKLLNIIIFHHIIIYKFYRLQFTKTASPLLIHIMNTSPLLIVNTYYKHIAIVNSEHILWTRVCIKNIYQASTIRSSFFPKKKTVLPFLFSELILADSQSLFKSLWMVFRPWDVYQHNYRTSDWIIQVLSMIEIVYGDKMIKQIIMCHI